MAIKSKILGVTCAVTILGAGLAGITYANETTDFFKNVKGKIHNCLSTIDFSGYENLTDEEKEELNALQTQLKEIMQEEKNVRNEMEEILKDAGIEVDENVKAEMKPREMKELEDEEKTELKDKNSLTDDKKAELRTNKEFKKGKKEKVAENSSLIEN